MQKFKQALDGYFEIGKRGSSFKVETFAGATTFLAMCYILTLNPSLILNDFGHSTPMWASVFLATVFGAIIGTLLMALVAKMPYAQASGMGLNSQVGALIGGAAGAASGSAGFNFGTSMFLVLISGVIFLALTLIPCGRNKETGALISLREKIFDGIPAGIRAAIPVGIGLFIALIGFKNSGIVISTPATLVSLVDLTVWELGNGACQAMVCLFGLLLIAILSHANVKGATIIGILGATLLAMPLGCVSWDTIAGNGGVTWAFWDNFANFFSFDPENGGAFFACFTDLDFTTGGAHGVMLAIMTVVSFCMIDMFDTMGTIMGCATKAGLVDKEGKPLNYGKCMYADAIATVAGACLGTSTVTTFVESGAGVAAGGKTGFTALVVAGLFLLSIFIMPVFAFIPSAAAASALIYVGVLMMSQVKNVDFTDIRIAVPAFLAIVIMPFGYSITNGIGLALISYVVIAFVCWLIDLSKYSLAKKAYDRKGGSADGVKVYDVAYGENGVVYTEEAADAPAKPAFPISVVTAIVAVLFLVYFFVPKG